MLGDLISRVFIIAFFLAYLVVAIFVIQWIFRTWFGGSGKQRRRKEPQAADRAPQSDLPAPESRAATPNTQSRADNRSLAAEPPRHRSTHA